MWLSRGLLASTLLTAIKAQDDNNNNDIPSLDIPDLATQIRGSIFAVSLIPHAETTLSGGHGTLNDNDDAFPATALPHDQSAPGGASPNTPVAQQPPTITIPPSTDYPYERIIKAYTGTRTIINVVTTIAEPDGTRAGTVIVELASTLYSAFTPGQSGALTIPPSLEDPMFTVIQAFPGPTTLPPRTITISASGTNPGTVIIQTPWPETPNTATPGSPGAPDAGSPDTGSPGSGSPDSGAPGAGSPDSGSPDAGSPDSGSPGADAPGAGSPGSPGSADTSNVVIIQTYTGTVSITRPVLTTITAPGGGQGTVVIQVPPGTQGAGETVTIPPSADSPFTTILRPHTGPTPISTAVTILIPPTAGGDGGTIVIETPTPDSGDTGIIDPGNKVAQPGNELPTGQRNVVVTLPSDPNSPFVTIVQGHDGTDTITVPTTITIQPSGGEKGTIIIETPNAPAPTQGSPITIAPGPGGSTTTIVREHTGDPITVPTTITITGAPGQPGTIIIETPSLNSPQTRVRSPDEPITIPSGPDSPTTIFRPHVGDPITEPITLTIAPSGGQPGTVIIETPAPSTPQPGQETITIPAGGDSPWATIVRPHPGDPITSAITITQTPVGDQPGTIIIETPVTKFQQTPTAQTPSGAQTSPGAQTGPDGSVQTSQPGDSGDGELTIPPSRDNPYITIYRPHTGDPITAPITITQTPANGQPGTIIIETPATRINTPAGTEPITIPTASDRPYVTIYRPREGSPITEPITITQPPANGQPGTIIIETPAPEVTVAPTSSGGLATVFRPHTGDPITAPITIADGSTVYIETPPPVKWAQTQSSAQQPTTVSGSDGYITIYTPYPGPGTIDTPITIVTPPRDGQPGTVLIETPVPQTPTQGPVETPEPATTVSGSDGYVTIYTPYPGPGKISSPITIITPPQGGQPGTVLIETPVPDLTQPQQSGPATVTDPERWVTIYTPFPGPGTISQPITITQPPANGQPGTILIETPVPQSSNPSDFYVTVYRPYPGPGTITTPITLTQPPANGQPGTIFIETPAPPTETPTPTVPQMSAGPITIPPGPTGSYVTIYRPYPGPGTITAPITYTQQPSNGQPGTAIIETPVSAAPSTTETPGGTLTVPTASDRPYVTIYRPYPGPGNIDYPITMTQPPANGQPGTIIIETPTPVVFTKFQPSRPPVTIPADDDNYITIYRPHTGAPITAPITVTTIAPSGGQPGTVIIETPAVVESTEAQTTSDAAVTIPQGQDGYVTVYRPHTGSPITAPITVTTILPSGGQPGTVIIETPGPVDPTQPETTTAPPPVTIPADQGGYVTVYRPYPGPGSITAPLTVGTIAPSGGQPGTVIIETPVPQTPTETQSPPVTVPQGDDGYVTVYRPYPGPGIITAPITVTTIAPSGGQPGTVIIETPVPQTPAPTQSATLTVSDDQNGYITIYRPYTGASAITAPITVTTIPPSGGQPGTVIIETLVPQTPTETQSSGNPPVTIPPGPDNSYVTVYQPYPGPGVITAPVTVTTIEPSGGQPGTIIIQTPVPSTPTPTADPPVTIPPGPENSYVTVYRPHEGPDQITAPITVTTIEPTNGQPGTIIIETPGLQTGNKVNIPPVTISPGPQETYVTVYRPHTGADVITAPITVTTIAPSNGQPGTVIIETPVEAQPTSTQEAPSTISSPGASYITVYRPHTGPDVITAPVTVTTIPPSGDQPGTVIIETPALVEPSTSADEPTTVSSPGATYVTVYRPHTGPDVITAPVTVTTIPPSGDQPGTVIIETPTDPEPTPAPAPAPPLTTSRSGASYLTVYRPHTGADEITGEVTITTIDPTDDGPGTIIIETPIQRVVVLTTSSQADYYVTVYRPHEGPDVITEPVTVTTIAPLDGQPGTVIIETPGPQAPPVTTSGPAPSYITITRPYTGQDVITAPITVTTIPPQGDEPGTVIIETPTEQAAPVTSAGPAPSYVTVYRPHTGPDVITEPVTVTTIAPTGDQPGTVIIETPGPQAPPVTTAGPAPSYITIYRPYSGTDVITGPVTVTTIAPEGDQPGTVIIETPGQAPATTTSGPAPSWITVYRPYSGVDIITAPITVSTIQPDGDQPGTIIIETPVERVAATTSTYEPFYVTVFRPYPGPGQIDAPITVTTIAPEGDQPGTVIIETPGQAPPVTATPEPSYVTVFRPYTGTGFITEPTTVTTIEPQGDQPGTVIVETPGQAPPVTASPEPEPYYITVYRPYPGPGEITAPVTVTTISPSGTDPGTVIIETPAPVTSSSEPEPSYVTVYRPYPGPGEITAPVTVTTIEPSGTEPGTVIIETPGQAPPVTSSPQPEPTYVTVYRPYPGPGEITAPVTVTTIEPSGTEPGTVIIETPGQAPPVTSSPEPEPSYVTVYRPYPGPGEITAPVTVTTIEPSGTEPGTVIIETPGQAPPVTSSPEPSYITVYRPYPGPGQITEPVTVTTIEPQGTEPGTVIIETPGQAPPVTTAEPSYITVYRQYPGPGQITGPITVTTIEPSGTEPGTVIIETQGPITTAEPTYITVYRPYPGPGQITEPVTVTTIDPTGTEPGTIIIETPGQAPPVTTRPGPSWITTFRAYTGTPMITESTTVTTIDPQGDEPGTVIIETPVPVTSSPAPSWITIFRPYTGTPMIAEPTTVTTIDPQGDQPGTVIIETPGQAPPITATPEPSWITVFRPYPGPGEITAPVTVTTIEPQGDQPGTVIIETPGQAAPVTAAPASYVTVYTLYTGAEPITGPITVTTIPPQGDEPGTVVIETPGPEPTTSREPSYITVYRPHSGPDVITAPVTVTTIEPQGDQPGTVIIETPGQAPPVTTAEPSYMTIWRAYTGVDPITNSITVTTIPPQGDQPGTVIIETPVPQPTTSAEPSYITVYRPYPGPGQITAPVTVTTIEPQGDQPGTVIIETPGQAPPITTSDPAPEPSYITVYRPYPGPGQITAPVTVTTIEPSGTEPGTVIIETPGQAPPITTSEPALEPSYVTVYRPYPGPGEITAPVTVTTIEPQGDQPGTVIIETPGQAPPITTSEPAPEPSYITVYRPYPGPGEITAPVTVTTIEPQGDQPGTVIIETPGQAPPITTSEPAPEPSYITVYRLYTGPGEITAPVTVTTIEPSGTEPGTVIIETPGQAPPITTSEAQPTYITIYTPYPGPGQITTPITVTTIEPQGTEPGTVIIETPGEAPPITTSEPAPEPSYVTVYRPYPGPGQITAPVTVTTIEPQGTEPGTVIIETPGQAPPITTAEPSYITITRPYSGVNPITGPITVTTIPPTGTDPGTVIIETPEAQSTTEFDPSYITITRAYRGIDPITGPITVTTIPPTGIDPGTVIIETPEAQTTSEFEPSYITIYRPYSGVEIITAPTTVTTIPPQGTDPGTVIIETPGQAPPITTSDPEPSYITITRPYTGAEPITAPITVTTIPPTGTDPGTVIIETPDATTEAAPTTSAPEPTYVTIYRPYTGSDTITAPVTVTTIAPTNGEPGTVIIETQVSQTQSDSYVTVYRPYTGTASYSEPITVTTIAPTNGEPGTVIIETLAPQTESPETTTEPPAITIPPSDNSRNVTVIRQYPGPGTIDSPITSYEPPSGPGEPGTVIIETPAPAPATTSEDPGRNVTVYTPGPPYLTAPLTRFQPATAAGEPGTVIIETPVPTTAEERNVTIITEGPESLTAPFTTYSPPGSPGDPGTVIIETPGPRNVTITREGPTFFTTYSPPGASGDPGTFIVETPAERNVTVVEEGPEELTEPHTTYSPPRSAGDPGTIIIDTPRARLAVRPTTTTPEPETTSTEAATINTPTAPTASTTEPITEPASTDDGTTSNPDALTITPDDKHDHITVVEPNTEYPGVTDNITHIIPPTDGQPGTHVIYTPVTDTAESTSESTSDYVTRFETITIPGDPSTLTKNDTASGDPETTGVETNTIIIPPSGTEPGTVLVHTSVYLDQTLAQHGNVTITRAGPPGVTTPFTTYEPPAQETDPGTIIIETPDYNVTITRAAPESITTTFTTYSPPANPGDPGTVIVETPDYNVTITREAPASITTPFTTYNPPGTPGDPGTVVVETPNGDYNVTITRAAPASITTPFTTYSPPATPGDPGTVIVETPDYNVTITRAAPPSVTTPFTTYLPPGTPGDPGTVIVETPDYNVTITRAGPSSVTTRFTTYSPPGSAGDPGTIIIETPDYSVTVTRSGPTSWTTYSPPASADDPGAIFIDVPEDRVADPTTSDEPTTAEESRNVTITRARPSTATDMFTTYEPPATRGDPGTIIIETPLVRVAGNDPTTVDETTTTEETTTLEEPSASNVTITEVVSTITRPYTTYSPAGARGDPGTVIIELPPDHNVTVTEYVSSRTAPYTTYSRAAVQGDPNTVIIELPPERNVTTTEYVSTITAPYTTYSPPGAAGDPGTIIIELPPDRNVTTTEYVSTITAPYTTYSPPGAAGDPGTIIIELPPERNVTTTEYVSTITAAYTTYSPPASPGDPGTIIIELPPDSNVTITEVVSTITAPYTTYSPPGAAGDPGTVIVELPPDHNVTITTEIETITEPYTTYSPPANRGDPGTIIIELPPDRNVTITKEVDTITEPYTTYSAPANRGDPGTVIVELPPDRNVTVTTVIETITQAYTTYASPANRGDPGTVIVELPPDHNVTITTQVDTITAPYTTYSPPANRGDPGTIIVELPPDSNVTITTQVDTITAPYTTYSPPANRGDPGTIIVELPPDHNVTITTEVDTITAPYTTYSPPANRGDPGTIIVEMPPDRNVTITTIVDTITAPYTTYSPPSNRGDPGTVIVELPPDHNVTITTEVETITEPYTTYSPPANRGDPGTIIVEMPPDRNVTTTVAGPSTLTGRYTTYSPPGRAGDPGTIIVETPPHHNITITTEGDETLTGPFTTYIPPGSEDDPGTILIETPRARYHISCAYDHELYNYIFYYVYNHIPCTNHEFLDHVFYYVYNHLPCTNHEFFDHFFYYVYNHISRSNHELINHKFYNYLSYNVNLYYSAAAATVRFDCDVYGYLFQKTSLYRVEITTGKTTLIKSGIGPGGWINGIGYNRYDDYIYGMVMDDTGSQLIRIGADGGWTLLSARVSNRNVIMGDIDNQGRYWFSDAGRPWWAIDLYPGSSTYGKIILSGTATHDDGMADWAFVPGGGDYMYAIQYTSTSSTLTRFSRTSYTWQTLKAYGNITGNNVWGALYAAADGNLYGSENTSGNIYKFPIAPTIGNPKFLAAGPVSSWNDGARCIDSESIVA
ncbi:hypothetical protein NCS57_00283400 [Fusarium keratoplasticum]|uniref:Uncharacterized protein n=1 Tax=Fusarium keratoplasticum TaxID=1328300 RepID=A0ACC0RCK5_9HYPO|nr:hypothetical protein NCS57_00283400 [Fusarium keratoplasticum]KAI8680037.1 hypothetical protein NCS57_00283400 [Fusarium keratoplasticum]